jgi:hypothetical protein
VHCQVKVPGAEEGPHDPGYWYYKLALGASSSHRLYSCVHQIYKLDESLQKEDIFLDWFYFGLFKNTN